VISKKDWGKESENNCSGDFDLIGSVVAIFIVLVLFLVVDGLAFGLLNKKNDVF
jgi:hypothetical protein